MRAPRPVRVVALGVVLLATAARSAAQESAPAAEPLSLSLDDAVALMLRNNLALRSALVDEQIEETRVREALGAYDPVLRAETNYGNRERLSPGLFPDPADPTRFQTRIITSKEDSFDATLGVRGKLVTGTTYDLSVFNFYQFDKDGGAFNPIWSTTAQLQMSQPLLRGAWTSFGEYEERSAFNRVAQARQTYRGAAAERVRTVRQAYFDLVAAYEDLATRRRSVEVADELVAINRIKVEAGAFPPVEMTSAESGRAARRAEAVTAEAALNDAEDRLRREIFSFDAASEWTVRIRPTEPLAAPPLRFRPVDACVLVARANEPRLLKARLAAAQAEDDVERRRSERRPKLDAVGSTAITGLSEDGLQPYASLFDRSQNSLTWSLGVAFEVPLGNRAADAREAAAALALTKARIDAKNLEIEIDYGVRKTLRDLDVAERVIKAREEALRFADQQLEVERTKLDAQTSTNFQVFEVEDQRNRRRTEVVQAWTDYRLKVFDLERITGAPLAELTVAP